MRCTWHTTCMICVLCYKAFVICGCSQLVACCQVELPGRLDLLVSSAGELIETESFIYSGKTTVQLDENPLCDGPTGDDLICTDRNQLQSINPHAVKWFERVDTSGSGQAVSTHFKCKYRGAECIAYELMPGREFGLPMVQVRCSVLI